MLFNFIHFYNLIIIHQVYQNYLLAGAWVLISGLQTHLTASMSSEKSPHVRERDEKGRSPCKTRDSTSSRSGLQKFQQSFGVLSVALATRALSLLSELFDDLHLEICGGSGNIIQVNNHTNVFYASKVIHFSG